MQQIIGKVISRGVTAGRIFYYDAGEIEISRRLIDDPAAECARFDAAVIKADEQLSSLYRLIRESSGEENAAIFKAQQVLLSDQGYSDQIHEVILNKRMCAEYAVSAVSEDIAKMFSEMEDEYMRERSMDIKDIKDRLLRVLSGRSHDLSHLSDSVIIASDNLSASDVAGLDKRKVLGFICGHVSENSHAAILMRAMNIPALTGINIDKSINRREAALISQDGCVILDPDDQILLKVKELKEASEKENRMLHELKGRPTVTKGGRHIRLFANAGNPSDIDSAIENDAEGIGLMRSEFLYLESRELPSEDSQFEIYKAAAIKMHGKPLIIRTADLGSDKQPAYLKLDKEDNPALGLRGIRISLEHPDMFIAQLRAIYRASAFGNISIMFPMIISLEEVLECKKYAAEVRNSLKKEGIEFNENVRLGIMIETPAAAMISETLAKEVDFFSIGTNDLAQYTLAADRGNSSLEHINNACHPAVLKLIRMTVENGHKGGAEVGICGELAADTSLTQELISYGVDELSVSPAFILPVRNAVIS